MPVTARTQAPLTVEQQALYLREFRIVRVVAKTFHHQWWARAVGDLEERVAVLSLHFVEVVRSWDPARFPHVEFEKFAFKCLRRKLRAVGRQAGLIRVPREPSERRIDAVDRARRVRSSTAVDGEERPDFVYCPRDPAYVLGDREEAAELTRHLHPRDRQAVELCFGLADGIPRTFSEIGLVLGVGKQRAEQLVKRAIDRMRREAAA